MSSELDAVLALMAANPFEMTTPVPELRAQINRLGEVFSVPEGVTVEPVQLGGIAADRHVADPDGPVILYLHGGGYVIGSPTSHRHLVGLLAEQARGQAYAPDYRMAPEAPFPAAIEDGLAAYEALTKLYDPARIAIAGDSAGGGLTFATAIAARDKGLRAPAALVGISPWVNMGTGNESYDKLGPVDPILSRAAIEYFADHYLAGAARTDPAASPLFAELRGLPPVLIQVGDREVFLGDAVRMHQNLIAAGVDTELKVWKQMFHVWHAYWPMLPEGRAAVAEIAAFLAAHCRA